MYELPSPYVKKEEDDPLAAEEQLLETLDGAEYWRRVCPHLHVDRRNAAGMEGPMSVVDDTEKSMVETEKKKEEFVENGFFHLEKDDLSIREEVVDALALGVVLLMQKGWPASFIFVYDEAWAIIDSAKETIHSATGGSRFLGDVYSWYVDPNKQQKGWGPHRDRMGSGPNSFRDDRTPMLSTTWFALTNAGPNNSCMYVVPRQEDPYYEEQDLPDIDPLATIFANNPDAYQSIRCLPCMKGCAWHFSHKIIHWGSYVAKPSSLHIPTPPRIAMSWVVGDTRFEEPAFSRDLLPYPPVHLRVAFIAGQQIAYGGQTGLRKGFKSICYRYFKRHSEEFTEFYRDKVEYIFYCRPAPPKEVHLKERTKQVVDVSTLEFASKEDDSKLDGLKGMFGSDSSSEEESDSE